MKHFFVSFFVIFQFLTNSCLANNEKIDTLINDGLELYKLEKFDEAISKVNFIIESYAKKSESIPEYREYVSAALALKGSIYSKKAVFENNNNYYLEAISCYDILLSLYQGDDNKSLDFSLAHSLFNKGQLLQLLDYKGIAFESYSKLITNYKSSQIPHVQRNVANAMINKAALLVEEQLIVQSTLTYQSVIEFVEKMRAGDLQPQAAIASLMICNNFYIEYEFVKEFNCHMQIISKFKNYSDSQIKEIVRIAKEKINFSKSQEDRRLESIKIGNEELINLPIHNY
jgi:tetratricopeptide (TPR) repeat protein